jgi:hypothetical protein
VSVVRFDYVMHDEYDTVERCLIVGESAGIDIDPDGDLADKIGRPFNEVILHCTLDTDTGAVTILGAET